MGKNNILLAKNFISQGKNYISQKYYNQEFAPGIATYGIDGKSGTSGKNGTSVFVCQYNITTNEGLSDFGTAIRQNLVMQKNSTQSVSRNYINGDCFLFPNGNIYKIVDIDRLKTDSISNQLTIDNEIMSEYLSLVGQVELSQSAQGFGNNQNRLVLDTTNYKGFIINLAEIESDSLGDITSPFTIISNDTDSDGRINFINMKSVYAGTTDSELSIFYDSDNGAYHIKSEKPIVVEADLKVEGNVTENYDGFSSVLTESNGYTTWHAVCAKLSSYYEPRTDTDDIIDFRFVNNNTATDTAEYLTEKFVRIQFVHTLKDDEGNEIEGTLYTLKEVFIHIDEKTDLEEQKFPIDVSDIKEYYEDNYKYMISLIGPVEIYITPAI